MLRNVLEDYVSRVSERDLDLPFLLLLPAMGFFDVHYTHGTLEFGKDFIAKREENGGVVQYSFQTKAGEITLGEWRGKIIGQMYESLFNPAGHSNFDTALNRKIVLVTTGDLSQHASIAFQGFQGEITRSHQDRSVEFWAGSNVVDHFERFGLTRIHRATRENYVAQSQFFLRYSQALDGTLTVRQIETYSRHWTEETDDLAKRLLWASIEAEVIAQQCAKRGRFYEALYTYLALLRVVCLLSYDQHVELLRPLYERTITRVYTLSREWIAQFRSEWDDEFGLTGMMRGTFPFLAYPVQCARIIEATALAYFTTDEDGREDLAQFLAEFVLKEPGCAHPVGDYYAVHLVLATLILCNHGQSELASALLNDTMVWVCDRHTEGFGLAGFEADEKEETRQLLGYAFESIEVEQIRESLLATVCCDLAAFLDDPAFYADVVNDAKSCELVFPYWQPRDTAGSCLIEGEDVLGYPNVEFRDEWSPFVDFSWAEHVGDEVGSFRFVECFGLSAAVAMVVLLRDRYFLKLWPELSPLHAEQLATSQGVAEQLLEPR